MDAGGIGGARGRAAARQHRPAVQVVGHDADLPQRQRRDDDGGFPGRDARGLVLRQRISVPVVDVVARHSDRGRRGWRDGDEAGLQRRSALAAAGRLHLDDDLQRILAGDRCRAEPRGPDGVQVRGPGRRDAGGRALGARGPAGGPGFRRDDGEVRARLDEGLEMGRGEPR